MKGSKVPLLILLCFVWLVFQDHSWPLTALVVLLFFVVLALEARLRSWLRSRKHDEANEEGRPAAP
jgi:hypothetical protein